MKRECGDCNECCIWIGVKALNKPPAIPCAYLCDKGCSIYKNRPNECAKFDCAWLQGQMPEEDQPCNTHVVCYMGVTQLGITVFGTTRPSEKLHERTFEWLMMQSHKFPVVLGPCDKIGETGPHQKIYRNGVVCE